MKKNKIFLWYDEEGDYLELILKKSKDTYFNEIKKDCAEIIDKDSGRIVGYAVFNFSKRKNKFVDLQIPVNLEVLA